MRRWLDTAILYVTVFAAAAVSVTLLGPVLVADWLRSRSRRARARELDFAHRAANGDRIPLRGGR